MDKVKKASNSEKNAVSFRSLEKTDTILSNTCHTVIVSLDIIHRRFYI